LSNHLNTFPDFQNKYAGHDVIVAFQFWFLRRYREVSIVLILNILALGIYVFNISYGSDDYALLFQKCNLIASGRWAAHFIYNYLFMNNYMPVLSPLVGMTVMILAGFELTRLWHIRNFYNRILIMAFFSLYPYTLEMYCFRINVVTVPWAYFLAVLALNQKKGWIASILLCISLGIYQATLGMTVCVWLMTLLFRTTANQNQTQKSLFSQHLKGWAWIILGIASYLLIMKLTTLWGPVNSRIAAGFFSHDPLRNLLKYSFIILLRFSFIPEYVIPWIPKTGVFICVILGTGILLIQSRMRLWFLFVFLILPYAAICHMLPLANPDVPWRISFGLIALLAGLLAVILQHKRFHKIGLVLGSLLIFSFILVDNARMFEQYIQTKRDIAMANRIACRIESLPEYQPGMKFIIVGKTGPVPLTWDRTFSAQTIRDFTLYFSKNRFGLGGCFETSWSKYAIFTNYLQIPLIPENQDMEKTAQQWIKVKGCQPWPHPSSIFTTKDTLVLFLGPS
jgi:hypothetical protein